MFVQVKFLHPTQLCLGFLDYLNVCICYCYTQVESEDYRVFMLNAYSGPARRIICEVDRSSYAFWHRLQLRVKVQYIDKLLFISGLFTN